MSIREAGPSLGGFFHATPGSFFQRVSNGIHALEKKIEAGLLPPAPAAGRTVYVLHSGMRDPENEAALSLQGALKKRGVKATDMIVMPAVYPLMDGPKGIQDNLRIFEDSSNLNGEVSKKQYKAYQAGLTQAGVKPGDKIVWVGDSAGGQMGFTLARMAKDNKGFTMDTVVTLGSPIAQNQVPPEVKIRHYTSSADQIQHGRMIGGQVGKPLPDNLDGNDKIRWFNSIGHCDWYKDTDPAVVDRIITEANPDKPGIGANIAALPIPGASFGGLLIGGLEFRNSVENNRGIAVPDNGTKLNVLGGSVDVLTELDNLGNFFKKAAPKKAP